MRTLVAFVTALTLASCGNDNTSQTDMTVFDLSASSGDMSVGPLGCSGYDQCLNGCAQTSSTTQDYLNCKKITCDPIAKPEAITAYDKAVGCGQAWCLGKLMDMGAGVCVVMNQMLVDAPGQAAGACSMCLADALAGLIGNPCSSASSPNCNPPACSSLYATCAADTP